MIATDVFFTLALAQPNSELEVLPFRLHLNQNHSAYWSGSVSILGFLPESKSDPESNKGQKAVPKTKIRINLPARSALFREECTNLLSNHKLYIKKNIFMKKCTSSRKIYSNFRFWNSLQKWEILIRHSNVPRCCSRHSELTGLRTTRARREMRPHSRKVCCLPLES